MILTLAEIEEGSRVLEIGPGRGALTAPLLEAGARLRAVELDRDVVAELGTRWPELDLVQADAAAQDYAALCPGSGWVCVANLPYNVGTRILQRLLEAQGTFDLLVLMFQREVAERLVAPPGSRKRGSLSAWVASRATASLAFRVPPGAFVPPPKVDSAVVRLVPHASPRVGPAGIEAHDALLRVAFTAPRKTIRNNLRGVLDGAALEKALEEAGLEGSERPGELSATHLAALAAHLGPGGRGLALQDRDQPL